MHWLHYLSSDHPIAYAVLILSLVAVSGLALGSLRWRGLSLGVAGALFSGLAFGHFGFQIDHTILDFSREFGLILFVYTIGVQVGPGFFNSLRKQGFRLNLLAFALVLMGAALAVGLGHIFHFPIAATVGLFSGATTNTPALGAAQETLKNLPDVTATEMALPALAYAVAYPFGIMGIIVAMLGLRWIFKIDPKKEIEADQKPQNHLQRLAFRIRDKAYEGVRISEISLLTERNIVITRVRSRANDIHTASPDTLLRQGDVVLAVGRTEDLERFCEMAGGQPVPLDLVESATSIRYEDVVVTRRELAGRSVDQIDLNHLFSVAVSRIIRAGVEMTAVPELRLQFGDRIRLVGEPAKLKEAAAFMGNSLSALNRTSFIPVFIGISLGVLLGNVPISIPGLPASLSLGLAGGPLVMAIVLSRLGRLGPISWYMPLSANLALRELGIVLFLSCVGLKAGNQFVETLLHGDGLIWMAMAAVITIVPLFLVGAFSRLYLKHNFMTTCGLLAGTMTDPPALAFANNITDSEAPSVAYATVYPLTMLLRILAAQMILLFFR